jgi:hypothetical protein
MSGLTYHGACGKGWKQRGNRTGHCSGCHETFEGIALFDAHQRRSADGSLVCLDPAVMKHRGKRLRLVYGTWRGPQMPGGTFKTEQHTTEGKAA